MVSIIVCRTPSEIFDFFPTHQEFFTSGQKAKIFSKNKNCLPVVCKRTIIITILRAYKHDGGSLHHLLTFMICSGASLSSKEVYFFSNIGFTSNTYIFLFTSKIFYLGRKKKKQKFTGKKKIYV